ncbi:hypothetical protein CP02DC14_1375, partial [Chlamydia psittaci 02DC14]
GLVWFEPVKTGLWPGFSWSGLVCSRLIRFQLVCAVRVRFDLVKTALGRSKPF